MVKHRSWRRRGLKLGALVYICALGVLEIIPLYNTRMYVYKFGIETVIYTYAYVCVRRTTARAHR